MASELFEFLWTVPEGGFRGADGYPPEKGKLKKGPSSVRVLTEGSFMFSQVPGRQYDPFQDTPGLFRTFGDLEPAEEAILKFANRFGNLGEEAAVFLPDPENPQQSLPVRGEPIDLWIEQIFKVKKAIRLWEAIREENGKSLANLIRWDADGGRVRFEEKDLEGKLVSGEVIASSGSHQEWLARFPKNNLLFPAKVYLNRLVNGGLDGRVSPRLLQDRGAWSATMRIVPGNLLGFIWLQLANSISGNKVHRVCQGCKEWFEVGRRPEVKVCGPACRNRLYRDRIEKALVLHGEGKRPKQIAAELGTDEATVKEWLSKRKG